MIGRSERVDGRHLWTEESRKGSETWVGQSESVSIRD